jgi:predicted NAD-dependent protein-ADP-ribosyltransferase YbiA (DUF1768 family)
MRSREKRVERRCLVVLRQGHDFGLFGAYYDGHFFNDPDLKGKTLELSAELINLQYVFRQAYLQFGTYALADSRVHNLKMDWFCQTTFMYRNNRCYSVLQGLFLQIAFWHGTTAEEPLYHALRHEADPEAMLRLLDQACRHFHTSPNQRAKEFYESGKAIMIVLSLTKEKIRRNSKMRKSLAATKDRFIVHCSEDHFWGTGLPDFYDPRNYDGNFPGYNWHGIILMAARTLLQDPQAAPTGFRWPKVEYDNAAEDPEGDMV